MMRLHRPNPDPEGIHPGRAPPSLPENCTQPDTLSKILPYVVGGAAIGYFVAKASADSEHNAPESIKTELAGDGRPAPAALPGDCCRLPSPTRSLGGSERPKTCFCSFF